MRCFKPLALLAMAAVLLMLPTGVHAGEKEVHKMAKDFFNPYVPKERQHQNIRDAAEAATGYSTSSGNEGTKSNRSSGHAHARSASNLAKPGKEDSPDAHTYNEEKDDLKDFDF